MIRRVRGFFGGAGGGALKVLRVGLKAKIGESIVTKHGNRTLLVHPTI